MFELVTGEKGVPQDKNQRVYIMSLREDRLLNRIRKLYLIPTECMTADALTKSMTSMVLMYLLSTGILIFFNVIGHPIEVRRVLRSSDYTEEDLKAGDEHLNTLSKQSFLAITNNRCTHLSASTQRFNVSHTPSWKRYMAFCMITWLTTPVEGNSITMIKENHTHVESLFETIEMEAHFVITLMAIVWLLIAGIWAHYWAIKTVYQQVKALWYLGNSEWKMNVIVDEYFASRTVSTQSQDTYDRKNSRFKHLQGVNAQFMFDEHGVITSSTSRVEIMTVHKLLRHNSATVWITLQDAGRLAQQGNLLT